MLEAQEDVVGAQKDVVGVQKDVVEAQEDTAGAAMMYWVDCRRGERLEFLDSLSFPPIPSRLGELEEGAAGLERFWVTTCHGPLQNPGQSKVEWWQSLAWVPGSGAGLDLVPSRQSGADLT